MFKFLLTPVLALSLLSPVKPLVKLFSRTSVETKASSSVVMITGVKEMQTIFGPQTGKYKCSGFYIDHNLILTAAHCVGTEMTASGVPVKLIKADEYYDLALLKTSLESDTWLEFRDEETKKDEVLTAIGHAYGWKPLSIFKVTVMLVNYSPEGDDAPCIIVRGTYIGGMSGGPVIDKNGKVVSIVQKGTDQVGCGVPVLLMRAFLLGVDTDEDGK